jgi:hypothetical protein
MNKNCTLCDINLCGKRKKGKKKEKEKKEIVGIVY